MGVTVVLLTCAYRSQEFIRVGYYVNNEYENPELKENPPQETDFSKVIEFYVYLANHGKYNMYQEYYRQAISLCCTCKSSTTHRKEKV